MLHLLFAALLATVSQANLKLYKYERTLGACRGGQNPERNAGLVFFRDRNCRAKCNSQASCTGYVLPKSNSSWCETYTSKEAEGDGRSFWCYMKTGEELTELPPSVYKESQGACRGGEEPEDDAGLKFHNNRNCKTLCDSDYYCMGYVLPKSDDKNWCETYTSRDASGDGRAPFTCYMKMPADSIQNVCKAEKDGDPKTCQCYNGYDMTCRSITTEEACKSANCSFVNGKCKGKAKTSRIKCKKTRWVAAGGEPMCNCLKGCTVQSKNVRQRVRRRRANKNPKAKFKCKGKAMKFE